MILKVEQTLNDSFIKYYILADLRLDKNIFLNNTDMVAFSAVDKQIYVV